MNQILILLLIILLLCLFSNKETFKLKKKRGYVKFSVPELTDDETADLIGGLQSVELKHVKILNMIIKKMIKIVLNVNIYKYYLYNLYIDNVYVDCTII